MLRKHSQHDKTLSVIVVYSHGQKEVGTVY